MPETEIRRLAEVVGRAIAKHRAACALTQEQVAERLGIGIEAVSRIERGVVLPSVARLAGLADIFECNIADLLTEASHRANDQATHLAGLLSPLSSADRALIIEIVERLVLRLRDR